MHSLAYTCASCLINALWQIPLVAAAAWAVSRAVQQVGLRAQHAAWVLAWTLAVLTPALPLLHPLLSFVSASDIVHTHLSIALLAASAGNTNALGVTRLPAAFVVALLLVYSVALLYFAARLGWSLSCTAALLSAARPLSLGPQLSEAWSRCKRAFHVENARILVSPRVVGPVTVGFWTPALLLPAGFLEACTPQDSLAALAHECAHMRRRDFQKNLFYEVASLVIAFHPVTWLLKSRIAQTREMICDSMATETLIDARVYAHALLRLAAHIARTLAATARVPNSHAIGIFDINVNANILEKRIMRMQTKQHALSLAHTSCRILPGMVFLLAVAAGGAVMALAVEPAAPTQTTGMAQPYGTVYRIGKDVIAPKLISSEDPVFPASAAKTKGKFNGMCVVGLVVDASGAPRDVHVVRSLGPGFDANAIEAGQHYRFTPATRSGDPVAVAVHLEINFRRY